MRKLALIFLASVALLGSACGGGSDKKDNANASVKAGASVNGDAASAAAAAVASKVCGSRSAINVASAYASAAQNASQDYNKLADGLRAAADAAPAEIKDDFQILVDAEAPFFTVLAKANGDYMSAAQDPAFQAAAQKMQDPKVPQAAKNIGDWFTAHCS